MSPTQLDLALDPGQRQREAYERGATVWVAASAGSGKTTVLTRRVLSLLLQGTAPSRILCLTFTKAAAAEMANRINETLSRWTIIGEGALDGELVELLGKLPDAETRDEARRLFARVLDAPGGITIATIHAFCQSVLRRFPLEAGVAPHFELMDDRSSAEALIAAREAVLAEAREGHAPELAQALAVAVRHANEAQFTELLGTLAQERARLDGVLARGFEAFAAASRRLFGLGEGETAALIVAEACARHACDEAGLAHAAAAMLGSKGKTDQKNGAIIAAWLENCDARVGAFDAYLRAFFTASGGAYAKPVTATLARERPEVAECIAAETRRLELVRARRCAAELFAATAAIVQLGAAMLTEYARFKTARALLDYDDLVLKTRELLARPGIAPWVLFKLDGGLDHLLVDEAQDTNPEQWEIIRLITEEFFAGDGAREGERTVFAVGDAKQSIYSFQRADPAKFIAMRAHFEAVAGKRWRVVPLDISFRSVAAVLAAVDGVFAAEPASDGVALEGPAIRHYAHRAGAAGLVELWPPVAPEPEADAAPWDLPRGQRSARAPRERLAQAMAAQIRSWLDRGERIEARDRALRPGDVMVLVRRRGPFVAELVRALKQRSIPVAGVDRMKLTEQLAVQDMMALAQFLLLPEDDLTLATVLKGPLFGLSEEELFALAWRRSGSLWAALLQRRDDAPAFMRAADELSRLLARVDFVPPYELFAEVLGAHGGRLAILSRLGPEADDPLNELLAAALAYERGHGVSLQGFLHWLAAGEVEIKRDLDQGARDEVRVLTVHGAKGLEAPVVFLPDTLQLPQKDPAPLWTESGLPIWLVEREALPNAAATARAAARKRREQEYRRLLYVAMTRAADRLYIGGWETKNRAPAGNWHELIAAGLKAAGAETFTFDCRGVLGNDGWSGEGLRLVHTQTAPARSDRATLPAAAVAPPLPQWCWQAAPAEPAPPRPLAPSQPQMPEPSVRSPLGEDRGAAFLRGRLVHRLLQSLPTLAPAERATAGQHYLALPLHGLSPEAQGEILRETLAVLDHPDFAALFGPDAIAEVPVVGLLNGRALSGQIDRLVVGAESVLIVDYKTMRPVPPSLDAVPQVYFDQLAAYRAAVAAIFPGRAIRCALLWTDGPILMPIPPERLGAAA